MLENFIMQVRRPMGVSSEREAFVSRTAQASAAACNNKYTKTHDEMRKTNSYETLLKNNNEYFEFSFTVNEMFQKFVF